MKKYFDKLLNPSKTKLFWLYFIVGILVVLTGIVLMPVWTNMGDWCFFKNWGMQIINIIICACILVYLFTFLLKKLIKRTNGVVKVLTIVEFVLLALIALGCILQQFKVINIGGACAIFGLALWARGVVELFRAYYHQKGNNEKYPVWWLAVAIAFVTFGTYIFAKPLFEDVVILWIFVILIMLLGIILFVYGFLTKPVGKKTKKTVTTQTKKEEPKKEEVTKVEEVKEEPKKVETKTTTTKKTTTKKTTTTKK